MRAHPDDDVASLFKSPAALEEASWRLAQILMDGEFRFPDPADMDTVEVVAEFIPLATTVRYARLGDWSWKDPSDDLRFSIDERGSWYVEVHSRGEPNIHPMDRDNRITGFKGNLGRFRTYLAERGLADCLAEAL